ncbi:unnamed protein product [Colias eurytheme]|nr:unnamed protein product [Colias eurytheme]
MVEDVSDGPVRYCGTEVLMDVDGWPGSRMVAEESKTRATDFSIAAIMARSAEQPRSPVAVARSPTFIDPVSRQSSPASISSAASSRSPVPDEDVEVDVEQCSDGERDASDHAIPSPAPSSELGERDTPSPARPLAPPVTSCNCEELLSVDCQLETKELWDKFHDLGTEMIITKTGRPPTMLDGRSQFVRVWHNTCVMKWAARGRYCAQTSHCAATATRDPLVTAALPTSCPLPNLPLVSSPATEPTSIGCGVGCGRRRARGVSALHRSQLPTLLDDVCPQHPPPLPARVITPTDCIYHPPPSSYILPTCLPPSAGNVNSIYHILQTLHSLLFPEAETLDIKVKLSLPAYIAIRIGGVDSMPVAIRCSIPTVQLKQFTSLRERPVNVICAH